MIGPQQGSGHVVRAPAPRTAPLGELGALGGAGVSRMPLLLVSINAETQMTSGRAVMDEGDGLLVDLDEEDLDEQRLGALSPGSHAFVRCYREQFLRCGLNRQTALLFHASASFC